MRLKTVPEDFVVREAVDLRIRRQPGPFRVYLLEKKGWNTADAIARIAQEKRVSLNRFAYGGKKDRHGHTFQYVTVQHAADLSLVTPGYSFQALGYSPEPIGPTHILTNRFELVLREMDPDEARRVAANAQQMAAQGFPNYFDDQRFGSLDRERGFIAEKALQGRWEEALQIYLTNPYPGEKKEAKDRKALLAQHWGDWAACRQVAKTAFEQRTFDLLQSKPGAFREALATVRAEEREMWLSAYQSFLWNEMLRRLLTLRGKPLGAVPGVAGDYHFASPDASVKELTMPMPGRGMRFTDQSSGLVMEEILRERRLRPASLEGEVLPGIFFHSFPRPAWVLPQSLSFEGPAPDELYPGHQKLSIRFALPRGAYATMLLKGLALPTSL